MNEPLVVVKKMVEVFPTRVILTIRGAGGAAVEIVLKVKIPVLLKVKVPSLVGEVACSGVCHRTS